MLTRTSKSGQTGFFEGLEDQLDRKHPLYCLANAIDWKQFEAAFAQHYSKKIGRPAKSIRLMVGLLLLKHIRNISDESVVEQWSENVYYQYFCGEQSFQPTAPCEASELVHFRNRIGVEGIELIFKESIRINGKEAEEKKAVVDTTVQEKNITFPTDSKLYRKIINKCKAIAVKESIELRQTYTRTLQKLYQAQRHRKSPQQAKKARAADRRIKTIAGRLMRELERKLPAASKDAGSVALFKKALAQKRNDKDKIYSLHEPHVQCISKGKEHKKYEFGSKVSIITTKKSGVIVGALNIQKNDYDGHTLEPAIQQQQRLTGNVLENVYADRGYRGVKTVEGTTVNIPDNGKGKAMTAYQKKKRKRNFARRSAIEPKIGHLKEDHRLRRNYYKGIQGDDINVMLAAAAMNCKRMMNKWKEGFLVLIQVFLHVIVRRTILYQTKDVLTNCNWIIEKIFRPQFNLTF